MSQGDWHRHLPRPLWSMTRLVRSTRKPLGSVMVDADLLDACAKEQQGMVIDRCPMQKAAALLDSVGEGTVSGVSWVITATDRDRNILSTRAERQNRQGWVYSGHERFQNAATWDKAKVRMLLTSVSELREPSKYNPRRRERVRQYFCPILAVVDPALTLCDRGYTGWDPAWVIRDALSLLCAVQQTVPVLIFTERDLATVNPSAVQKSFGLSGLLYFELATGPEAAHRNAPGS